MRKDRTLKARETCGMEDPKLDGFSDVKRALHAYLLKTDKVYQKASRDSKARNEKRKLLFTSAHHR